MFVRTRCEFCADEFETEIGSKVYQTFHCLENLNSKAYKEGSQVQSHKIGKGLSATYNGKFYRSSYEVAVAEYLTLAGIEFNYENITGSYKDKRGYTRTKRNDFEINGEIYEVYGYQNKEDSKNAFEAQGYKFHLIGPAEVQFIKQNFLKELRRKNTLTLKPIDLPDYDYKSISFKRTISKVVKFYQKYVREKSHITKRQFFRKPANKIGSTMIKI